ncbi:MAG: hypothetical protein U1F83_05915 [Verrucomicrobiota bacterium]
MMPVTTLVPRARCAALLILGGIAVGLWLRANGAGEAVTSGTNVPPAHAAAGTPLPKLPIVARPPAEQPAIGLPTDTHLDKTPPRKTVGLDLTRNGWTYNCMECHKLFPARWHYDDRPFNEHKNIQLDHGNNRFCLNCHHSTNRNAFADYDGAEIAQADVVKLCAKCHGTIYRDWQAGVHGRQNGFWNANLDDKTKLRCIQCHDPHSPKFKAMQPLPPLRYPPRAANPPSETKSETAAHH